MIKSSQFSAVFALLVVGCGSAPKPEPVPPASSPAPIASPAPTASAAPVAAKATEPTAEEQAKAKAKLDAAALLERDRAKFEAEQAAEVARWTPALRAEAKRVADARYATGQAAMRAVVAGKHRRPASPERDQDRHPVETFTFYGLEPGMTVLEFAPGEAWFTELLAPVLAKRGKLIATTTDPDGPKGERTTFYGQRFKAFLARSPEAYGKVEPLLIFPAAPKLGLAGSVDMVVMMRAMHGVVNAGKLDVWLAEMLAALKPGGILAIEQHRAAPDAKPEESAKKGYLPEEWVIERVEAAGFRLVARSELNANPRDTKDYAEGVWTLPPSFRLGDRDRATYAAIGESDRMTLRFVKPAHPAPAK